MDISPTQARVLKILLAASDGCYGYEILKGTGLPSGTVYPMLSGFERRGWIVHQWEDTDPRRRGRPQRKRYWVTEEGRAETTATMAALAALYAA